MQRFTGRSEKGIFQDALEAAIKDALKALSEGGADVQIKWQFESSCGTRGGITGVNLMEVTISAWK